MPFGNPITGGQGALLRTAIKSPNYVPGVSGWSINRDGTAEFSNGVFRGAVLIGTPPNPRINITTVVPPALAAALPGLTIFAGYYDYFNATDLYFDVLAFNGINNIFVRGSLIAGVVTRYEEFNSGVTAVQFYGSAANVGGTTWDYRGTGTMRFESNATIERRPFTGSSNIGTGELVPFMPIGSGSIGQAGFQQIASNTVTEQVFASAAWDDEVLTDFQDGHMFRVDVNCAIGTNGVGINTGNMCIRQGQATTTGTILAQWTPPATNTGASSLAFSGYFLNNTGFDRLNTFLSLCFHRATGTGILALQGNPTTPLEVVVYDLGDVAQIGVQQQPFHRNMT
jgi:hypothetical protein